MPSSGAHRPSCLNRLRNVWADGGCAFGAFGTIPSVQSVHVLARSGLDYAKIPLDLGAMGICFPMTSRREDAEAIVKAGLRGRSDHPDVQAAIA